MGDNEKLHKDIDENKELLENANETAKKISKVPLGSIGKIVTKTFKIATDISETVGNDVILSKREQENKFYDQFNNAGPMIKYDETETTPNPQPSPQLQTKQNSQIQAFIPQNLTQSEINEINDTLKQKKDVKFKYKKQKHYFIIFLFFIFILLSCFVLFLVLATPNKFVRDNVGIAMSNIKKILIKNNYCNNENDCDKKEFVLYDAMFNTIYLNIYNNVDKNTQYEINENLKQLKQQCLKVNFSVSFYKYQHIDYTDNAKNKKQKITINKFKI